MSSWLNRIEDGEPGVLDAIKERLQMYNFARGQEWLRACNNHILQMACRYGRLEVLKYLFEEWNFTPVDARVNEVAAIRWAAEYGHLHILEYLFSIGMTAEDAVAFDNYAIKAATKNNHDEVVAFLNLKIKSI